MAFRDGKSVVQESPAHSVEGVKSHCVVALLLTRPLAPNTPTPTPPHPTQSPTLQREYDAKTGAFTKCPDYTVTSYSRFTFRDFDERYGRTEEADMKDKSDIRGFTYRLGGYAPQEGAVFAPCRCLERVTKNVTIEGKGGTGKKGPQSVANFTTTIEEEKWKGIFGVQHDYECAQMTCLGFEKCNFNGRDVSEVETRAPVVEERVYQAIEMCKDAPVGEFRVVSATLLLQMPSEVMVFFTGGLVYVVAKKIRPRTRYRNAHRIHAYVPPQSHADHPRCGTVKSITSSTTTFSARRPS